MNKIRLFHNQKELWFNAKKKYGELLEIFRSLRNSSQSKIYGSSRILSSLDLGIQFIIEISNNNLLFLDILINKQGNKIFAQNQQI